jgi:phosphatidylserine/phosphatidylglycerophosphate/cardiolipin synthase-like enzyme
MERPGGAGLGHVRLWQDAAIFTLVGDLIGGAHRRVMVEIYELGRDEIVTSLGGARARGLSVRVITDPTVKASRDSGLRLDALGIPERAYPIDDVRHQIDHVKLLIADEQAAIGGMNWGRHSDRNHDYVLQTHVASDVQRLAAIFEQDWALAGGHPAPLAPLEGTVGQTAPGTEIRTMLDGALAGARRRILAEIYTLTDHDVIARLAIAHRRGVDVRVILDPNQEYNFHAFALLRAASVAVRWYPVPRGVLLHAKIGLVDDELILGSANWTLSGLGVNHELDIKTRDPYALAEYGSRFESDWARSAT